MSAAATPALASGGIVGQIQDFAQRIETATAAEAKATLDRMRIAREWAKIQENAAELTAKLSWLEAVILRRIGQLDPKALSPHKRSAARHFATLDDSALTRLLADYPTKSAVAAHNLWAKAEGLRKSHDRGRRMISRPPIAADDDDGESPTLRLATSCHAMTVRQAAAVLMQEYAGLPSTTVSDVVEDFIAQEMPHLGITAEVSPLEATAFREGLRSAVRAAINQAPAETTERSHEIPAYVTFHDAESDQWLRIPSEYATVGQARQMLAQRKGQIETMRRSLESLERVINGRFGADSRHPSEYLRDDSTALSRRLRVVDSE